MADLLEATLKSILPQVLEFKNEVEVCISNNASPDNTRQVVMKFKDDYPELTIKYNENKKNLGFDRNLINVVNLAEGKFVWMFGDDILVENGLKEVIAFIRKYKDENIGLIVVGNESHGMKKGKKVILKTVRDKDKPKVFELNRKDIITTRFDGSTFISVLLLNNKLLKDMFIHDTVTAVNQSIGTFVPHMVWYVLMFMKNPSVKGYRLNKTIVVDNSTLLIKFTLENEIIIWGRISRFKKLLLSTPYSREYTDLINRVSRDIRTPLLTMTTMKAFRCFNYKSFPQVIVKLFYLLPLRTAVSLSFCFIILSITPSGFLKSILKQLYKTKFDKSFDDIWNSMEIRMSIEGTTEKGYDTAAVIEP